MAEKQDVDGLLDMIFRSPEGNLLLKAYARFMAGKQRLRQEQLVVRETIRYEKGLGTLATTGQPGRLWWKDN